VNPHPDVIQTAVDTLTPKQFDAWYLAAVKHLGTRAISVALNISRGAAVDRLDSAARKLRKVGVYQDGSGHWVRVTWTHTTRKDAA